MASKGPSGSSLYSSYVGSTALSYYLKTRPCTIDTLVVDFIRAPQSTEATMNHHMRGTPPKEGGMGVGNYIGPIDATRLPACGMQCTHITPGAVPFPRECTYRLQPNTHAHVRRLVQSMGALPGVSLQPMCQLPGGPNPYNSEDTENSGLLAAQHPTVGQPDFARKYHPYSPTTAVETMGRFPTGILRLRGQGLKSTSGANHHGMGNGIAMAPNWLCNRYLMMPTGD